MSTSRLTVASPPPGVACDEVLPGVWRWAAADGSDRCGTALATGYGLVLVDPPPLAPAARRSLEAVAGPLRHVVLTSARLAALAAPYAGRQVTVAAGSAAGSAAGRSAVAAARPVGAAARAGLPGGLIACALPPTATPDGEVALLWRGAGGGAGGGEDGGLLLTGDVLRVVGQTPVYREGEAPPMTAYLEALSALRATGATALAPARQAPGRLQVVRATAWAAGLEHPRYQDRAAPVQGPRFLVPQAVRVLDEALRAPVVLRRPGPALPVTPAQAAREEAPLMAQGEAGAAAGAAAQEAWIADPFACAGCGRPQEPMRQTCSGPTIARLCPDCRAAARERPPAARVLVCEGGCCTRYGARAVASAARAALTASGLTGQVAVVPVRCIGRCALGPYVRVATARGTEPADAAAFRAATAERVRTAAAAGGREVDAAAALNLERFAAGVRPDEVEALVAGLAADLAAPVAP